MSKIPLGLKKVATLIILKHENKYLLLKRLKDPNANLYTPVGGKLDPFESPAAAAIRETKEETGIEVKDIEYVGLLTETSPAKYNWVNYVYLAEIEDIPPPPCNEGTLEWIAHEDILKVPTPKTDWFIYEYVRRGQKFNFSALFDETPELIQMREDLTGKLIYPE